MIKKIFLLSLFILTALTNNCFSAISDWQENQSKGAKTRLVASFYLDQSGEEKLIAGVEFEIASGWKIYGHGTQSSGIGIEPNFIIKTTNYDFHNIFWPEPKLAEEKIGKEIIQYFIYQDHLVLPIEIQLKKNEYPTQIELELNYGLCNEICVPAKENFTLQIDKKPDLEALKIIQKYYPQQIIFKQNKQTDFKNIENKKLSNFVLLIMVLIAILGGAILNIMPCVLPVISIKLLSIIKNSNQTAEKIRLSFLSTFLGILSCFLFFAILTSIIKLTGNSIGWGLQFQNPYFLIFLVLILMTFIANILGSFEFNFSKILANILNKKISNEEEKENIFLPNFLSGILAVLLATPCSAPFLGSAISFSLTQNFLVILIIFVAIGFGFSFPYILLMIKPKLIYKLPKSGNWTNQAKQIMSGFLAATVIWLIYVLTGNIGLIPAFLLALISILFLLSFKIKILLFRFFTFIILVSCAFYLPISLQKKYEIAKKESNQIWQEFDENKIQNLIDQQKTVVIDITADWCITCKFNKIRVLENKEIIELLKNNNIVAMRADITKTNEDVLKFMQKHNRFAIPFNIIYGPNAEDGILTNELLTKEELIQSIKKAQ